MLEIAFLEALILVSRFCVRVNRVWLLRWSARADWNLDWGCCRSVSVGVTFM